MKHAIKMATKKKAINWKAIIASVGSMIVIAALILVYLFIPAVSGFIDSKIDYLFKLPDNTLEQETAEENSFEEEIIEEEIVEEEPEEIPEEPEEEEETEDQDIAPTIKLIIYKGPLYSKGDDICYYRIVVEVTGDPSPEVAFTRDDSLGSLGPDKVQVNLTRDNRSFTLGEVAENLEGKASDSITVNWNCNRSPDINGISLSTDTLYISEQYEISVEAIDLDGDELAYSWSTDGGDIEDNTSNPAKWNTPAASGDYSVSISVIDGAGNESLSSLKIYVGETAASQIPENMNVARKESEGGYIEYGGVT